MEGKEMSKRKKLEKNMLRKKPEIGTDEVTAAEINPLNPYENGRYTGRLLNPDEVFLSEADGYTNPNPSN